MAKGEQAGCACIIPRAEKIARLNDELRQEGQGGIIVVTRGVRALGSYSVTAILALLRQYDEFDIDNDPHGERDFGDLELDGETLFWKVDYYDLDHCYASPDPADSTVTSRVITVMLAQEW